MLLKDGVANGLLYDKGVKLIDSDVLEVFCCPKCGKGSLLLDIAEGAVVCNGKLTCDACNATFPILNGVPRLVDANNYSESFGYQWNMHERTQLDSNSRLPISRNRVYDVVGGDGRLLAGENILEAGSGAGRFTEILVDTGANIFSFDYSCAVDANARNNGVVDNLTLFQGDIYNLPFEDYYFDHVLCLGVIQHTPDPQEAFNSLAKKVRPGGKLYIDVYTRSWYHLLHWKYILRPLTKRMDNDRLYKIISYAVPWLVPISRNLRRLFGRFGARLMPIVEYSHLGLDPDLNKEWAVLDTFDMYSPAHDHPQSMVSVRSWFEQLGFTDIEVWYGENGVVGRGTRPD